MKQSKWMIIFLSLALALSIGFSIGVYTHSLSEKNGSTVLHAQTTKPVEQVALPSFKSVAALVLPCVVQVDTVQVIQQRIQSFNPFDLFDFFSQEDRSDKKKEKEDDEKSRQFKTSGLGSGVIVRSSKNTYYVLTNNHVINKADEISVVLNDSTRFDAKLVGKDPRKDLALLSFDSKGRTLPVIALGDSSAIEVGDWVLAVGSPFGFSSTVTAGIVSAKGRKGPSNDTLVDFIQTDAAINSGNSGGALVNMRGELVGINSWIATKTGESAGLGFAIAVNEVQKVIEDFITYGKVEYGWLGVSISDVDEKLISSLKIPSNKGTLIQNLYTNSPAYKDGLQAGDFVVAVDGKSIENANDLSKIVAYLKPGQKSTFDLIRNGKRLSVSVKIAKRSSEEELASGKEALWPGINVTPITKETASYFKFDENQKGVVVVAVDQNSKAIKGLKTGDVIISINDKKIESLLDFYNAFSSASDKYMIEYKRGNETSFFGFRK